jgi:hypothetical protein
MFKKAKLLEPVDASKINITRDHYFSNAYIIDLPLDSVPDHAWQDIFDREWKMSRRLWDRKLFVIGDKLRLITTPNEMEEKLSWIKELVELTNKGIDEYNRIAPVEKQLKKQETLEDERTVIESVRDVLRKKFGAAFTR